MTGWFRRRRLAQLRATPLPAAWAALLADKLPRFASMSHEQRDALADDVSVFLAEKRFIGCAGLDVTDAMRVVIAGEACLLLLGRDDDDVFPGVHTILLYPTAWRATAVTDVGGGMRVSSPIARLGEAWQDGQIILAWDSVASGVRDPHDGDDVVLHEFAHALDHEDGAGDGAPIMPCRRMAAWATVLSTAWRGLQEHVADGLPDVLRAYGATNPAEFFAVATEVFFERGPALRAKHPALYAQLAEFYGQDPGGLEADGRDAPT